VRFHFQVRTETHVMLTEVADLRDSDEARVEAARRIALLLQAHAGKIWADEQWHMDVTDEGGLVLFALYVQAVRSGTVAD
jgi:hypothetical protein